MESDLLERSDHISKFEEPIFQHKRKMSGSPSKYVREPDLPIRKKVSREFENDSRGRDNDFFILGDQSKFRLDMIPYRARSLSSHRYTDSTDMLSWPDGDGDGHHHQHRSRSRNRHDNKDDTVSDNHYHKCTDELTNQDRLLVQSQRQQLQSSTNNSNYQPINDKNNNKTIDTKIRQQDQQRRPKPTSINNNPPAKTTSIPLKQTNTTSNANMNNKRTTTAPTRIVTNQPIANKGTSHQQRNQKTDGKEFRTRSDVGKFLNERHKEIMKEERMKQDSKITKNTFDDPKEVTRKETETEMLRRNENSEESLGEVIANKSVQNKENIDHETLQSGGNHHHHLRHRSLSEYQDKFQWRGLPMSASVNFNMSQSHLTWLNTPAILSNSEYADQFRPKSAIPIRENHHQHHHNLFREGQYGDDILRNAGISTEQRNINEVAKLNDNTNNITGENMNTNQLSQSQDKYAPSEHYPKNSRHYKSEYTVKFIPPSEYLLMDDVWVKADHVRRILGERNITQSQFLGETSRWAEHVNGERDGPLTVADLRKDLVPSVGSGGGHKNMNGGNVRPKTVRYNEDITMKSDDDNLRTNNNNKDGVNFHSNNNKDGDDLHNNDNLEVIDSQPPNQSTSQHPIGDSWFDYILELRKRADQYRSRGYGMNFSRDHLAQIRSNNLSYWDDLNSESVVSYDEEEVLARVENLERSKNYPASRQALGHSNGMPSHHFTAPTENFPKRSIPKHNHHNTVRHNYPSFHPMNDSNYSKGHSATFQSRGNNNNNIESFGIDLNRTNQNKELRSSRPRNFAQSNPIGRDSDELSDSLSSSLSLAEEVLERAKKRKDRPWTTQ